MARCSWCGVENDSRSRFCSMCGKEIDRGTIPGKCPRCGTLNSFGATKCEGCGTLLPEEGQELPPFDGTGVACKWCGKPAIPGQDTCPECSRRMYDRPQSLSTATRQVPSGGLLIAAILLIIAGAMSLIQGVVLMSFSSGYSVAELSYASCGALDVIFGLFAIVGGYLAVKRTSFMLVTVSCILASISFAFLIGSLLGFVALILVVIYRKEFD